MTMKKNELQVRGPYRTGDLELATALLTVGHDMVGVSYKNMGGGYSRELPDGKRQQCRLLFEFEMTPELNASIVAFTSHRLTVDANLLLSNLRNLKGLVSNANHLTLEEVQGVVKKDNG
jgi:hypothetical protein